VKNLTTGKSGKVLTSTHNQVTPSISGTRVVWSQEDTTNHWTIYIKNLITGESDILNAASQTQINADISNSRVVWMQKSSSNQWNIYYKNFITGQSGKIVPSKYNQLNPSISGTGVVWSQQNALGLWTIYMKNLATGRIAKVQGSKHNQLNPSISGTRIVWEQNNTPGHYTIQLKNLATGLSGKVQTSAQSQTNADISDTRIVWIQHNSSGSSGIYVKNLALLNNSPVKNHLIIPRLGINCIIRSDTPNAYNAVYHYKDSVYPGNPGECALLGHRTTYSALFRYNNLLQNGDLVIIQNSKTKYVYRVISNGQDIRWYFHPTPLTFKKSGEPILLLFTCHPPGRAVAKWVTHCKLISTVQL
jgi:sortase A